MSRLSIRPRPLDIHKKLPIVKSFKDFEDDDLPTSSSTRNSQLFLRHHHADDNDHHVLSHANAHHQPPAPPSGNVKKPAASEIPTPQFLVVDTYERDYSRTFAQPTSYLRARGARAELGEFVEYDLDNEDDDWLEEFNGDRRILAPERLEGLLFKLEVWDHKARERAGLITPSLGSPTPILLQHDAAMEALQAQAPNIRYTVLQSIFNYWKDKRDRWQKPVLRRLQPPPPVNDTNPYNVFRPREKAHRLHTRRMQRRENNVQSFEKLRQVRRNLDQAKTLLEALIKREEKKREVMESEVSLQRIQMKYKHETELMEDSLAFPGFPQTASKFGSNDDDFVDSDDISHNCLIRPSAMTNKPLREPNTVLLSAGSTKQEFRRRPVPQSWLHKMDPREPVLLFTRPLVPEKLAAAGISLPQDIPAKDDVSAPPCKYRGRVGRGGRLIFDRWNPLMHTPIDCGNSLYIPPKPRPSTYN